MTTQPAHDDASPAKVMRLRYAGACDACEVALAAGVRAGYLKASKSVRCLGCLELAPPPEPLPLAKSPSSVEVDIGVPGASARREHERRAAKREAAIRDRHPRLGGLFLALTDEPQSTTAWATGATGEERLGERITGLAEHGVKVLHDRRIPGTRANIDHIAVAPTGVYVIDAKRYKDRRPALRVEGGLLRPRVEKLMVGSRDCTKLVDGVLNQVGLVRKALADAAMSHVSVRGTLCFVEAAWPMIGGAFTTRNVAVVWPKKLAGTLKTPGALTPEEINAVHRALASAFPTA